MDDTATLGNDETTWRQLRPCMGFFSLLLHPVRVMHGRFGSKAQKDIAGGNRFRQRGACVVGVAYLRRRGARGGSMRERRGTTAMEASEKREREGKHVRILQQLRLPVRDRRSDHLMRSRSMMKSC